MRTVHIISREMFFLSKLVANSFSVLFPVPLEDNGSILNEIALPLAEHLRIQLVFSSH